MTFSWHGHDLEFSDHPYNGTITNERAIEIPIAWEFLLECAGRGLELGNVLNHYVSVVGNDEVGRTLRDRRVVDLYEKAPGVRNLDVFSLSGAVSDDDPFDWILSISTIEHVREQVGNPWAAIGALAYLRGLLKPDGRMLVTVGLGQNPVLDEFLLDGDAFGAACSTLVRTRGDDVTVNQWERTRDLETRPYGPTHGANAVWVGEWA